MRLSRQEYWSGLPFPSPVDHILSALSTMTHPSWVAPQSWLSFIELDKTVVLVWLDWLAFCDYGFSVSALWCPLSTPTVLLGFLLHWKWGISWRCSSKVQPLLLTLDEGYLLTTAPPDLEHGIAPLGPPVPVQPAFVYKVDKSNFVYRVNKSNSFKQSCLYLHIRSGILDSTVNWLLNITSFLISDLKSLTCIYFYLCVKIMILPFGGKVSFNSD